MDLVGASEPGAREGGNRHPQKHSSTVGKRGAIRESNNVRFSADDSVGFHSARNDDG